MTFRREIGPLCSRSTIAALVGLCVTIFARAAAAQAFLPPTGEGNVTVTYQNLFARGHLDLNGERMAGESGHDPVQGHAILLESEYGLTDRLAINASLPFIGAKYGGSTPHLVGGTGPPQEWDDGLYHATFQDFHLGARFRIASRPFAIAPFAEAIIPSHDYPALAHSAVGKDLRALAVGGAVGGFLDKVRPGIFFQAIVSYTITEEVLDIRPNRSHVDTELGYFITPRLAVRFLQSYQVTHAGFDMIAFNMTDAIIHGTDIHIPPSYRREHDRLQRSNYLSFGGGVGFALNNSTELFAAVGNTTWGENVHPLRGVSVGLNTHFRTRRAAPRADRQRQYPADASRPAN